MINFCTRESSMRPCWRKNRVGLDVLFNPAGILCGHIFCTVACIVQIGHLVLPPCGLAWCGRIQKQPFLVRSAALYTLDHSAALHMICIGNMFEIF